MATQDGLQVRVLIAVGALLGSVFALRVAIREPVLGLGSLYLVPVAVAALLGGRRFALAIGITAGVLFYLGSELFPGGDEIPDRQLALGAAFRVALFCAVGVLVAQLVGMRVRLERSLASREREVADLRGIQEALTPADVPERPGLAIATAYEPAERGVAGDFFMVSEGPAGKTVLALGDVMGHGIDAASRAAFVRTALASFAPLSDDPVRLLELANRSLIEHAGTSATLVTAACVSLDPSAALVRWALAGHPRPLRLPDGRPLAGARPGLPLGLEPELGCEPGEAPLKPGEGLLLYTDGLVEARPAGPGSGAARMDEERLQIEVASAGADTPAALVERLEELAREAAGGRLGDDLCLLAVVRSTEASGPDGRERRRAASVAPVRERAGRGAAAKRRLEGDRRPPVTG